MALCAVAVLTLGSCATAKESAPSSTVVATPPPSAPAPATAGPAPAGQPVITPVIGSVLAAPVPVSATDGKVHLVYEIALTNTLQQAVTLTFLAAVASDKTLLSLSGDGLAYWTRVIGAATPTAKLGPAQTALVWLDLAVDKSAGMPADITHSIGLTVPQPQPPLIPGTITETIAPTKVDTGHKPVTLSPPVSGPSWVDADGCCDMSAHRMAVNPLNGQLWAPERFAIDYIALTPDGRLFIGDKTKLESYPYYGADIHAVADGAVIAAVDNLPDQVAGANPSGLPLDQYGGNHIVEDIGGGHYAFYAHLKPGSIRVKPGDKLTTGQTIAALGNSGNSSAPHLHFHVMNTPDPLMSNGLPFIFGKFRLDSRVASEVALNQLDDTGAPAQLQIGFPGGDQTNVMPLDLDVMTYPTR
ncbi:MAG: M23 family metallopeptidase [Mycobacteriaceae bacterium]|nr:M23 family metallopeptidase [Mycobacteriaceae bacterium]